MKKPINSNPPVSDPVLASIMFVSEQLTRARELRCLTKTELAKRIEKTPSAITQFENSVIRPDPQTIGKLALALGFPISFFTRTLIMPTVKLDECHFRSLRSVSQYQRHQAVRKGELLHEIILLLEKHGVVFPTEQLSHFKSTNITLEGMDGYAVKMRQAWGLNLGPIHEPIPLFEYFGIRILILDDVCREVDAFSFWHDGHPYIMLTPKPASRIHFDLAHELGHLLMHEDAEPGNPETENEANYFASSFLLPKDSFFFESPEYWSLPVYQALKARWRVSIQALVVRSYRLGKLSQASYRRAFTSLNKLGMRQNEPGEWALSPSVMIPEAISKIADNYPLSQLAQDIGLSSSDIETMLEPIMAGSNPSLF